MSVHQKGCAKRHVLLSELYEGPFPRRCAVWWVKEKVWHLGSATPSRESSNCWSVVYDDGKAETEFNHVVVLDEALPASQEISLPVSIQLSDSWETVCFSPIQKNGRSDECSVLAACGISDSDAVDSNVSRQSPADHCDRKHVEIGQPGQVLHHDKEKASTMGTTQVHVSSPSSQSAPTKGPKTQHHLHHNHLHLSLLIDWKLPWTGMLMHVCAGS